MDDALPRSEVTMLMTPLGNPASSASAMTAKAERGVSSAGLHTTVHPLARAAPNFLVIMALGKFHGVMIPATPIGCLMNICCLVLATAGITFLYKKHLSVLFICGL